jgi:hypothetical protein
MAGIAPTRCGKLFGIDEIAAKRLLKKSEQQIPNGLKRARNDKNKGLARRG